MLDLPAPPPSPSLGSASPPPPPPLPVSRRRQRASWAADEAGGGGEASSIIESSGWGVVQWNRSSASEKCSCCVFVSSLPNGPLLLLKQPLPRGHPLGGGGVWGGGVINSSGLN